MIRANDSNPFKSQIYQMADGVEGSSMGRRKISANCHQLDKSGEVNEEGLSVQLLSAFVINLVALQQGASVSSSSVLLHSLQGGLDSSNSTTSSPALLFDF